MSIVGRAVKSSVQEQRVASRLSPTNCADTAPAQSIAFNIEREK